MYRVVFTSRATANFSRQEVKELCDRAAARNQMAGITGLFLFDGTRFLQALEGDEIAVVALMKRIAENSRHFNMDIIWSHKIERREFHEWSMSQALYGVGDDPRHYLDTIKEELKGVSSIPLKALFIGFASMAKSARFRYE